MSHSASAATVKIVRGLSSIFSLEIRGDNQIHAGCRFYQENGEAIYSPLPISALVET